MLARRYCYLSLLGEGTSAQVRAHACMLHVSAEPERHQCAEAGICRQYETFRGA